MCKRKLVARYSRWWPAKHSNRLEIHLQWKSSKLKKLVCTPFQSWDRGWRTILCFKLWAARDMGIKAMYPVKQLQCTDTFLGMCAPTPRRARRTRRLPRLSTASCAHGSPHAYVLYSTLQAINKPLRLPSIYVQCMYVRPWWIQRVWIKTIIICNPKQSSDVQCFSAWSNIQSISYATASAYCESDLRSFGDELWMPDQKKKGLFRGLIPDQ